MVIGDYHTCELPFACCIAAALSLPSNAVSLLALTRRAPDALRLLADTDPALAWALALRQRRHGRQPLFFAGPPSVLRDLPEAAAAAARSVAVSLLCSGTLRSGSMLQQREEDSRGRVGLRATSAAAVTSCSSKAHGRTLPGLAAGINHGALTAR